MVARVGYVLLLQQDAHDATAHDAHDATAHDAHDATVHDASAPAPASTNEWPTFDNVLRFSDGVLLYISGTCDETYLTTHVVPALQASKFCPVTPEGQEPRPMLLLPWRAEGGTSGDVTYLIVVDRLGARTRATWRGTSAHGEALAFVGGEGLLSSAGLVVLSFFLHHTSGRARTAFEAECMLNLGSYDDYLCLLSIPSDGNDLGLTMLVCSPRFALSFASLSLSLSLTMRAAFLPAPCIHRRRRRSRTRRTCRHRRWACSQPTPTHSRSALLFRVPCGRRC